MSSGTDIRNLLQPVSTTAGNGLSGFYYRRAYSGANSPRRPAANPRVEGETKWRYSRITGYNRVPKRGSVEEHNYSMQMLCYTDNKFTYRPGNTATFKLGWGGAVVNWANPAAGRQRLLGNLRTKVAGSSFNAAVAMAEGRESLVTITSAATAIFQTSQALRKGDYFGAAQALVSANRRRSRETVVDYSKASSRTFAENWLSWQYAWKPLLNDVYEGAQFLAHLSSVPLQHVVRVSTRDKSGTVACAASSVVFDRVVCVTDLKIKAILKEVDVVQLAGLTDPLSLAWETLPYSFVFDWFVPVSTYLQNRALAQALTGIFVETHFRYALASKPRKTFGTPVDFSQSVWRYQECILERTVSSSLQIPLPEVRPLGKWATWSHATSAVSLVVAQAKVFR